MDTRETRQDAGRNRRWGPAAAGALAVLVGMIGLLGWAASDAATPPRGEERAMQAIESRTAGRPPIDLAAPAEFETATFALG